ncbi:uncharacterized protein LOC114915608 [Cajanus cajan]|uniref:uncharacterized protein LOC114915608 n=1 Tax=Cajanus cajan TaxID=3821 RepID=UPI0010FBBCE1|nr:uncharacterized protein LOC114915608 [Cajanus cajan]
MKLLMQIELFLCGLEVQNLIIQADPNTFEMWKLKFGLKELTEDIKKKITSFNILRLPNAVKLYKDLNTLAKEAEANKDNENHNAHQTRNDQAETPLIDLNSDPH